MYFMSALQERGVSEVLDAMWAMHLEPEMEGEARMERTIDWREQRRRILERPSGSSLRWAAPY